MPLEKAQLFDPLEARGTDPFGQNYFEITQINASARRKNFFSRWADTYLCPQITSA